MRVDGKIVRVEEANIADKHKKHSVDVVVDRLGVNPDPGNRLEESLQTAVDMAEGKVITLTDAGEEILHGTRLACPPCVRDLRNFLFLHNGVLDPRLLPPIPGLEET